MFRSGAATDAGPVRRANEDSFVVEDTIGLLVVADGMGGHNAGEIASRLCVDSVAGFIRRSAEDTEFSWPYGIDPTLSYAANRLRTAIHLANRRVFKAAESREDYGGMGTTVVSVLIDSDHFVVGHVGDSRLYLVVNDQIEQITEDDSWAATVLRGRPAESAPGSKSLRHVLTNVLGVREQAEIHIQERAVSGRTTMLLCSDGVHGVLDATALLALLSEPTHPEETAQRIVQAALTRGARDNVTAAVGVVEMA